MKRAALLLVGLLSACSARLEDPTQTAGGAGGSAPGTPGVGTPGDDTSGGGPEPGNGSARPGDPSNPAPPVVPPEPRVVRLDAEGYSRTVGLLFDGRPADGAAEPATGLSAPFDWVNPADRFSTRNASYSVDPNEFGRVQSNAQAIAQRYADAAPSCEDAACERSRIEEAARRLWSRPPSGEEVDALLALEDFEQQVLALAMSPHLLFRSERGTGEAIADGVRALNAYELASALAFTLTGAPPDAALFEAAEADALTTDPVLSEHVDRLLDTPAYAARVRRFVAEYFGFDEAANTPRDVDVEDFYPDGSWEGSAPRYRPEALVRDAEALTERWVDTSRNQNFLATMLTDSTFFASKDTAFFYGVASDADAPEPFDGREQARLGVLTQPAWLVAKSEPDHNSPIKRGLFIQESLLCGAVPELPIDGVPALEFEGRTMREALAVHLEAESSCNTCHIYMDPLAFPLEQFDLFGRYRTEEYGQIIDVSGEINWTGGDLPVGDPVTGVEDLVTRLASAPEVERCFVEHGFQFWLGRSLTPGDEAVVIAAADAYAQSGGDFDAIIRTLVTSPIFRHRSVEP